MSLKDPSTALVALPIGLVHWISVPGRTKVETGEEMQAQTVASNMGPHS